MNEREIFLSALEIADSAARQAYLHSACIGNPNLLASVESLLASHDQSQFLNTPVVEQMSESESAATRLVEKGSTADDEYPRTETFSRDNDVMNKNEGDDENPLGYLLAFLQPASRPDSKGRLAHYEIIEVLGRGAFGTVLKAFDTKLERIVAIKVLAPEMAATSPARKRFLREARASAAIRHENVVAIYAVEEQPLPYLVMEYIPGKTLQQRLDDAGPLAVIDVLRLGCQIAAGLAAAGEQGLIHRDIKPGNILLEAGVHERVKITDFGLARAADDASLTQSSVIAGTPMYMAPEQALGKKLDQRADLFSLGSVIYQMVSGRPPFRAASTLAVLKRVTEDTPRPITEVIPETPQWLCQIITKLHAKNPDDRYQSAREVADVLANCESQLTEHSGLQEHTRLKDLSLIPRARMRLTAWWKGAAVVACVAPMLAFGLHAFNQPAAQHKALQSESIEPAAAATSNQETDQVVPVPVGWVQLFNGQDLTGWKTHPDRPGDWKVKDGVLVGSNVASYLFSVAGQFEDFHLRVEAKINHGGDSGVFFRSPFVMRPGRVANSLRPAGGYEVELHRSPGHQMPTGSLWNAESTGPPKVLWITTVGSLTQDDEWFVLEIIAQGNHFITKVNGTQTAACDDPESRFREGHFALQVLHPQTVVQFRKIEIKELPAAETASQQFIH